MISTEQENKTANPKYSIIPWGNIAVSVFNNPNSDEYLLIAIPYNNPLKTMNDKFVRLKVKKPNKIKTPINKLLEIILDKSLTSKVILKVLRESSLIELPDKIKYPINVKIMNILMNERILYFDSFLIMKYNVWKLVLLQLTKQLE